MPQNNTSHKKGLIDLEITHNEVQQNLQKCKEILTFWSWGAWVDFSSLRAACVSDGLFSRLGNILFNSPIISFLL